MDSAVVPGGCTKFVQAPDVCWNRSFKSRIQQYRDDWLANGEKSYTAGGNLHPPAMDIYLQWIVDSWAAFSKEEIRNSFTVCGVLNALDGSEDNQIHCFKLEGPASKGRELLQNEMDKIIRKENIVIVEPEPEVIRTEDGANSDGSVEV